MMQSMHARAVALLTLGLGMTPLLTAQGKHVAAPNATHASASPAGTLPVVMLSDLHFDPFQDPTKFERLKAAPASGWHAILAEPDGPGRAEAFAKLQAACPMRGSDSPYHLVEAALKAASTQSPHPTFVLVAGDLLVHNFDCRHSAVAPKDDYHQNSEFAAKTAAFIAGEIHHAFPRTPVYLAVGNNDSGCSDYHETPNSAFLKSLAESFAPGADNERDAATRSISEFGSYSVALPKPIERGRLIVLQDIFQAATYLGCNIKPNPDAPTMQLKWLREQLESARAHNEQVWVMAHIPPGVDVYNTVARKRDVCGADKPVSFLGSDKLSEMLSEYAPVIRVAIFGHTHMDEIHLIGQRGKGVVAAKLVPSISPINGNFPGFTLGDVDPHNAELRDYRVIASDNQLGVNAHWTEEYRYSTAYHRKSFNAAEVSSLVAALHADAQSAQPETNAYENNFMINAGMRAQLLLRVFWPQYACSMDSSTAAGFKACVCAAAPAGK